MCNNEQKDAKLTGKRRSGGQAAAGDQDMEYSEVDGLLPPGLVDAPRSVLKRVRALKKLQLEELELESSYYKRMHELEMEFQVKFQAVNNKRRAIVVGECEPVEADYEGIQLINLISAEECKDLEEQAPEEEAGKPSKGVPNFWLNVLEETDMAAIIQDWDREALAYLTDITLELADNPPSFTLAFHFAENPYFTNSVLRKAYLLDIAVDTTENPFIYDGPKLTKCQGTPIEWKEGMSLVEKTVKKKQKSGTAAGQFITKTVSQQTFFTFFTPPAVEFETNMDPDAEMDLVADFEYGQLIREKVIPRAVLLLTGEARDEDEDYDDDEDEDEELDDDDMEFDQLNLSDEDHI